MKHQESSSNNEVQTNTVSNTVGFNIVEVEHPSSNDMENQINVSSMNIHSSESNILPTFTITAKNTLSFFPMNLRTKPSNSSLFEG